MANTRYLFLTEEFCEQFDTVNEEATVCFVISNDQYDINLKCKKRNIDFWPMKKKGMRFFVDGSEIDYHGTIFDVVTCTIEEDNMSIDYCFYDVRGERVCFVSVLKE